MIEERMQFSDFRTNYHFIAFLLRMVIQEDRRISFNKLHMTVSTHPSKLPLGSNHKEKHTLFIDNEFPVSFVEIQNFLRTSSERPKAF